MRLPEFVDAEQINASFDHGLLTVIVPKAQAAKPRKISINLGKSDAQITG